MITQDQRLRCENSIEWYEKVIQQAAQWSTLRSNVRQQVTRASWAGMNEIQLWAVITGKQIHIVDTGYDNVAIYKPTYTDMPTRHPYKQYTTMTHPTAQHLLMLVFNGDHYNAIQYDHTEPMCAIANDGLVHTSTDDDDNQVPTLNTSDAHSGCPTRT